MHPALGPGVRERFAFAREAASEDMRPWREERSRIKAFLDEELAGGGLLVFPTLPGPGPLRSGSDADMEHFRSSAFALLSPAGLAGLPSLSLPLGTLQGAPVGLTLLGPAGCDEWVLRCGCELMESLGRPRMLFSSAGFAPIFFFL
ncbi:MAG: amidase family protein [Mesosutterella sp.]|nr:amidase family protein [Mesosutterella sp.]